ncbi:MAG: hypothetical protein H5U34_01315, partial [Klebsiella pneumoniae]|nr:hypothetical protein [Klebsiella pneumoniae]
MFPVAGFVFFLKRSPGRQIALKRRSGKGNLVDEIAYNAHDIDDGVRSGLITLAQVAEVPLF